MKQKKERRIILLKKIKRNEKLKYNG